MNIYDIYDRFIAYHFFPSSKVFMRVFGCSCSWESELKKKSTYYKIKNDLYSHSQ